MIVYDMFLYNVAIIINIFSWYVLPHSPYSPGLALSDYYPFCSLQSSLNGKNFDSLDDIKIHLNKFLKRTNATVWRNGIMKIYHLPELFC